MASKPLKKMVKLSVSKEGVEKITRERYHAPLRRQAPVSDEDCPTSSGAVDTDPSYKLPIDRLDTSNAHHGSLHALLTLSSHKLIEENACQSQEINRTAQMSPIAENNGSLSDTDDTAACSSVKDFSNSSAADDAQMHKTYPCTPPVSKGRPRKHPFKPGKYECAYCGVRCSKPSVLEKHVRAHTNERPFPCDLCQLGFKTKSNLYKHEKSNAHKTKLIELQERDPLEAKKYIYRQLSHMDSLGSNNSFDESRSGCAPGSRMTSFDSSTSDALTGSPMASFDNDLLVPVAAADRGRSPLIKSPIPTTPTPLHSDSLNELMHALQTTINNNNHRSSVSSSITERVSNQLSSSVSPQPMTDEVPKSVPRNVGASLIMPQCFNSDAQEHSIIAYLKVEHGAVGGSLTLPLKIDPSVWRLCSSEPTVGGEDLQLILGTTPLLSSDKYEPKKRLTPTSTSVTSLHQELEVQAQQPMLQDSTTEDEMEQSNRESSSSHAKVNNSMDVGSDCNNKQLLPSAVRRGPNLKTVGKAFSFDIETPSVASGGKLHRQALSLDIASEFASTSKPEVSSAAVESVSCRRSSVKERLKDKILRRSFSVNSPTPVICTSPSIVKSIEKHVSTESNCLFTSSMNSSVPPKKRRMLGYGQDEVYSCSTSSPSGISQAELTLSNNQSILPHLAVPNSSSVLNHSHDLLVGHNQASLRYSTKETLCCVSQTKSAPLDAMCADVKSCSADDAPSASTTAVTTVHSSDEAILNILATYASVTGAPLVNTVLVSSTNTSSETPTIVAETPSTKTSDANELVAADEEKKSGKANTAELCHAEVRIFAGGLLSPNDATVYIRGRGRGKYKCEICSIRCQKPSMLRKHIRTHAEIRPYICVWCNFSFKTKGNLTKHMKSKQHSRQCEQLGMSDVPTEVVETLQVDRDALGKQLQLVKEGKIDLEKEAEHDSGLRLELSENDSESDSESTMLIVDERRKGKVQQPEQHNAELDSTTMATSENPNPVANSSSTDNNTSAILQNLSKTTKAVSRIIDKAANLNLQQINELAPPNVNVFDIPQDKPLNLSSGRALVTVTSNGAAAPDCLRDFMQCEQQVEHVEVEGQLRNNHPAHQEQSPQEESIPALVEDNVSHQQHFAEARRAECGICGHQIELNQLTLHLKTHAFAREPIVTTLDVLEEDCSSQSSGLASSETTHELNTLAVDPRPFKCSMCVTSFRVQGHLSKHFRSKQHVRQLYALGHVEPRVFELIKQHRVPIHEVIDHDTGVLLHEALHRFLGSDAVAVETVACRESASK